MWDSGLIKKRFVILFMQADKKTSAYSKKTDVIFEGCIEYTLGLILTDICLS